MIGMVAVISALSLAVCSVAYGALSVDSLSLGVSNVQSSSKIDASVDGFSKIDTTAYFQTVSAESASLSHLTESSLRGEAGAASPTFINPTTAFNDSGYWACGRTTVYDDGTRDTSALTCAVSLEYGYLKGSVVEICYNNHYVYVTIDDVGNFSKYGYVMDFMPAVCHALGFVPGDNPYVSYRLID
jgi:hypothetical protein